MYKNDIYIYIYGDYWLDYILNTNNTPGKLLTISIWKWFDVIDDIIMNLI